MSSEKCECSERLVTLGRRRNFNLSKWKLLIVLHYNAVIWSNEISRLSDILYLSKNNCSFITSTKFWNVMSLGKYYIYIFYLTGLGNNFTLAVIACIKIIIIIISVIGLTNLLLT